MSLLFAFSEAGDFKIVEVEKEGRVSRFLFFRNRVALDFYTYSSSRIAIIQNRLEKILARGWPAKIYSAPFQGNVVVAIDGQILFTVDTQEAQLREVSPAELARHWVQMLQQALSPPTLYFGVSSLVVPVREFREVKIEGTAQGPITFSGCEERLALCVIENEQLKIYGVQPALLKIVVARDSVYAVLPVRIQHYAATFIPPSPLFVTGRNIPLSFLEQLVKEKVWESTVLRKGASLKIKAIEKRAAPLPGETQTWQARVFTSGPDYIPQEKSLEVPVINEIVPFPPSRFFVLSNEPEELTEPGILSDFTLETASPLRYLVHHKNATRRDLYFYLEVRNGGGKGARLHFVSAAGGPDKSELQAGFKATERFLNFFVNQVGEILTIAPGETRAIAIHKVPPWKTFSYLAYLQLLSGEQLSVQVSFSHLSTGASLQPVSLLPSPRWGIFQDQVLEKEAVYEVGKKWGFVKIGEENIQDLYNSQVLSGNYGLWFNIRLKLKNPTKQERKIVIKLDASAGSCAGVFLIEGLIKGVPYLGTHEEATLYVLTLSPYQEKVLSLSTLPVPGAHYPARLVVHAL